MSSKTFRKPKSHSELFSLSGMTAAVIGGGGHVCSALAKGFASAGANVAVIDIRIEKAEKIAKEINSEYGVKTVGLYADATNLDELNSMMNSLMQLIIFTIVHSTVTLGFGACMRCTTANVR
jgi:NAD(P)-dependent dehydrogenase (short-subunit alcohol dehydrogenase family)